MLENPCRPPCLTPAVEVWGGRIGSAPTSFIDGEQCLYSLKKNLVRCQRTFLDDPLLFRCALKKKLVFFLLDYFSFLRFSYFHLSVFFLSFVAWVPTHFKHKRKMQLQNADPNSHLMLKPDDLLKEMAALQNRFMHD